MPLITDTVLAECCSEIITGVDCDTATRILEQLDGFAFWCLDRKFLKGLVDGIRETNEELAERWLELSQPELPASFGACWVILVPDNAYEAMLPAFPLPLRWQEGSTHDPRLPANLVTLADQILDDLRVDPGVELRNDWSLSLADGCGLAKCDFSGVDGFQFESAWVPLAGGLITAIDEGQPNSEIWATGSWKSGLQSVAAIDQKLQAVELFGSTTLYVPEMALSDTGNLLHSDSVTIRKISARHQHPRQALATYLDEFQAEPPEDASLFKMVHYFLSRSSNAKAEDYYCRQMVDLVADNVRDQVQARLGSGPSPLMVGIVSFRTSPLLLLAACLKPQRCLLLYTPSSEKIAESIDPLIKQLNEKGATEVVPCEFNDDASLPETFRREIASFLGEDDPSRLVVDLTCGKQWMSLVLPTVVPAQAKLLYWWHENRDVDQRAIPDTLKPIFFEPARDGRLQIIGFD